VKKPQNKVRFCRHCGEAVRVAAGCFAGDSQPIWIHCGDSGRLCCMSIPAGELRRQPFAKAIDEGVALTTEEVVLGPDFNAASFYVIFRPFGKKGGLVRRFLVGQKVSIPPGDFLSLRGVAHVYEEEAA